VGPSSSSNLQREPGTSFQGKTPPITGEASFRGWVSVDGLVSGQLGANGGGLSIKQRSLNANGERAPELNGEIRFKEMLRVNGHVAGRIVSEKGTLIVATEARVDADIAAAAVVISGEVNGNVIGHNRVELSAGSVVRGNISTTSLAIKPGAFFDGDCYVIQNKTERES
jgi:cytoskeletal protein CcmA (bactofilin family)